VFYMALQGKRPKEPSATRRKTLQSTCGGSVFASDRLRSVHDYIQSENDRFGGDFTPLTYQELLAKRLSKAKQSEQQLIEAAATEILLNVAARSKH
jgi:hypothetical protein